MFHQHHFPWPNQGVPTRCAGSREPAPRVLTRLSFPRSPASRKPAHAAYRRAVQPKPSHTHSSSSEMSSPRTFGTRGHRSRGEQGTATPENLCLHIQTEHPHIRAGMSLSTWNHQEQPSSSTATITTVNGWATSCCAWMHRDKGGAGDLVFLRCQKPHQNNDIHEGAEEAAQMNLVQGRYKAVW